MVADDRRCAVVPHDGWCAMVVDDRRCAVVPHDGRCAMVADDRPEPAVVASARGAEVPGGACLGRRRHPERHRRRQCQLDHARLHGRHFRSFACVVGGVPRPLDGVIRNRRPTGHGVRQYCCRGRSPGRLSTRHTPAVGVACDALTLAGSVTSRRSGADRDYAPLVMREGPLVGGPGPGQSSPSGPGTPVLTSNRLCIGPCGPKPARPEDRPRRAGARLMCRGGRCALPGGGRRIGSRVRPDDRLKPSAPLR